MDDMTLDEVLDSVWQRWVRGRADRRSPFHTPIVATVDASGNPHQRVMVLRETNRADRRLRFHTDVRSAKVEQIGDGASVSVIAYDATAKIQIRFTGSAHIEKDGEAANMAWANSALTSKRCYLAEPAPGTPVKQPSSGLTDAQENALPAVEDLEAARPAFSVLFVSITSIEWLYLAARGHRRARFDWDGTEWVGTWLVP